MSVFEMHTTIKHIVSRQYWEDFVVTAFKTDELGAMLDLHRI